MSVTFFEGPLAALLNTKDGPVGRYITAVADEMVEQARAQVRDYFHTAASLTVDQDVQAQPLEGNAVEVGIRDAGEGTKSRRLAEAQIRGSFPWLSRAREITRQRFVNG